MTPRDERILEHLCAFRLSLRPILARLYFGDDLDRCQQVLSRLKQRGYIKSHQPFQGTRLACYQLDGRSTREFSYPKGRVEPMGGATLDRHLAILWWCCMRDTFKPRLEPEQVAEAMGSGPLHGAHCAQPAEGVPRFFHVAVPNVAQDKDVLYALKESVNSASADRTVAEWIGHKRYVFVLLFDRKQRVSILREATADERFLSRLPVRPKFRVDLAPTSATINEFTNAHRARQSS